MPVFSVADGTISTYSGTSYASVSDADDYLSLSREYQTAWAALAAADKETFLMFASRLMDQTIAYSGYRYSEKTYLRWPRILAVDCDQQQYDETEIPQPIKETAIEIAGYYALNTTINPSDPVSDEEGLTTLKVDVITLMWKQNRVSPSEANKYPRYIINTLRCLGVITFAGMGQISGIRFKQGCL